MSPGKLDVVASEGVVSEVVFDVVSEAVFDVVSEVVFDVVSEVVFDVVSEVVFDVVSEVVSEGVVSVDDGAVVVFVVDGSVSVGRVVTVGVYDGGGEDSPLEDGG